MHKKKLESTKRRMISDAKAKMPKPQLVQTEPRLSCLPPPFDAYRRDTNAGIDRKRVCSFMMQAVDAWKKHAKNVAPAARNRNFLRVVAEEAAWLVMEAVRAVLMEVSECSNGRDKRHPVYWLYERACWKE